MGEVDDTGERDVRCLPCAIGERWGGANMPRMRSKTEESFCQRAHRVQRKVGSASPNFEHTEQLVYCQWSS